MSTNSSFNQDATLSSLAIDNPEYDALIGSYPKRLETASRFTGKTAFLNSELERIQSHYLKPSEVEFEGSRVLYRMNFTAYAKHAYDWLAMGEDWSIAQIISSAKSGRPKDYQTNEEEFANAIIFQLRRGIAYLMYEKFLKEELRRLAGKPQGETESVIDMQIKLQKEMDKEVDIVFVTYSWDTKEHEDRVSAFTDFLRRNGFHAELDKMLSQEETAIDFMKMMHQKMVNSKKVVVVLSEGYKEKAENFRSGVGEEYSLIIKDIKANPRKYILVSFEGISDKIVPLGLSGREIVDMRKEGSDNLLFSKLMDHRPYDFSEVADTKPTLEKKTVQDFKLPTSSLAIEIGNIHAKSDNASLLYSLYRNAENICRIEIINKGTTIISDYMVEVKVPKELIPDFYNHPVKDGYVVLKFNYSLKLYPGQEELTEAFALKVTNHNINKVIDSALLVTVYSEAGVVKKEVPLKQFFRLDGNFPNGTPLSKELFLDPSIG